MTHVLTHNGQDAQVWLTIAEYAAAHDLGHRTVQRHIAAGKLPTAEKGPDGKWRIPANALPLITAPTEVVKRDYPAATAPDVRQTYDVGPVLRTAPLGVLGTLDEAAAALGTTVGGVRRLGKDGHLIIGRYGPRGSLRVYLPPTR